jgi:hypothetical protein
MSGQPAVVSGEGLLCPLKSTGSSQRKRCFGQE